MRSDRDFQQLVTTVSRLQRRVTMLESNLRRPTNGIMAKVSVLNAAIGNGATLVNFTNAATFDFGANDNDWHETITNPSRLTVPIDGYYYVTGYLLYDTSPVGNVRVASIYIDGVREVIVSPPPQASTIDGVEATFFGYLTTGQYIELYGAVAGGGPLDADADLSVFAVK